MAEPLSATLLFLVPESLVNIAHFQKINELVAALCSRSSSLAPKNCAHLPGTMQSNEPYLSIGSNHPEAIQ
jgi:hypothetical protein